MPAVLALGGALCAPPGAAAPSLTGQTGLVYMPDARIETDGTFRFGVSHADPYFTVWSSISLFPRLEVSGRYTTIDGVPGFADAPELGDYRDKAFDAKLILLEESRFFPAVALGVQDYLGTRRFPAEYLALGKRFGDFDLTVGYGRDRIDGAFGGVRYAPSALPGWRFTAEYDATDYRRDYRADLSGAARREAGPTYAVGYHSGWWGTQLSYQRGEVGANVYVAIPLMEREFIPKIHEPPPYTAARPRVASSVWAADRHYLQALAGALERQGFTDVHIRLHERRLELSLSHERISLSSRAVGRAARTALRLGPGDMTSLRITYTRNDQPLLTYTFADPATLERYFEQRASRAALEATADIGFASGRWAHDPDVGAPRVEQGDTERPASTPKETGGRVTAPVPRRSLREGFGWRPFNARIFFNDPGEPVRYDTFMLFTYGSRLAPGLFLNGAARFTLFENVSDIRQPSTSLLPHVRSDVGEYYREGDRLRLQRLLLNKYALVRERLYGRLSLGYYEEMFAGGGGQILYLPGRGDWAVDLAVDALRQRAPGEAFGFREYSVVTAVASLHYRFPQTGLTTTARAGRFLAKDEGVRFELKRRFRSGVELGAWYSWTNEKDITNPGSPDKPYRDKGLFVSIPLNAMLTRDTQERATLALADYTRDVGQLVASPGDLYRLVERPLMLDSAAHDPLTDFAR